jgi:hypothetical protein
MKSNFVHFSFIQNIMRGTQGSNFAYSHFNHWICLQMQQFNSKLMSQGETEEVSLINDYNNNLKDARLHLSSSSLVASCTCCWISSMKARMAMRLLSSENSLFYFRACLSKWLVIARWIGPSNDFEEFLKLIGCFPLRMWIFEILMLNFNLENFVGFFTSMNWNFWRLPTLATFILR